jgi:ABC-type Mn2+/Zn2+ transport system permease subunit
MGIFTEPLVRKAALEVALLGLACGPLGVWVLLHRQAFAAESLSHGMLPGLVIAAIAGAPLILGAAGGVLVAAAAIALASRDPRLGPDVGVAVAVGALVGAGTLLALGPDSPPRLEEVLFGDPLGATTGDLIASGALAIAALAALAALHRSLTLTAFDRVSATALGARPHTIELALLATLAAVTVAAAPALGNLLLVALVLGPATAALLITTRLSGALALAAGLAVAAGAAGLALSYELDIAAGASIAICAIIPVLAYPSVERTVSTRQRT